MIFLSVFLISLSSLAYEILLVRLLSIERWHHYAGMIISLALLGYGISGTFLHLTKNLWKKNIVRFYTLNAFMFSLTSTICFILSQKIPFTPMDFFWNFRQFFYLMLLYCTLMIPFFFAANCIGSALSSGKFPIQKVYSFDLIGAGLGGGIIIFMLSTLSPYQCLPILSMMALAGGLLVVEKKGRALFLMASFIIIFFLFFKDIKRQSSSYKPLEKILKIPKAHTIKKMEGPEAQIHIVKSPHIPFRHAPGLSLNYSGPFPKQWALLKDGMGMTPLHPQFNSPYFRFLTSYLPFIFSPDKKKNILLFGMEGDTPLWQAVKRPYKTITLVEDKALVFELITQGLGKYSEHLTSLKNVTFIHENFRPFLNKVDQHFDLIQIPLSKMAGGALSGLSENFHLTRESFHSLWKALSPKGFLAFTLKVNLPPKSILKLLSTFKPLLVSPLQQIVAIRSWGTLTLVVSKSPFKESDILKAKQFSKDKSFDLVTYPGMTIKESNLFNVLSSPIFFTLIQKILKKDGEELIDHYKFDISPTTDERPYFFNSFKWKTFFELWEIRKRGGMGLMDWSPWPLIGQLIQAIFLGGLFILAPLFLWMKKSGDSLKGKVTISLYFSAIAFGFFFIEMAFIKRMIPFLGLPLMSLSFVLVTLLISAGLGSAFSKKMKLSFWNFMTIFFFFTLFYLYALPLCMDKLASFSNTTKYLFTFSFLSPLGFIMGFPFPMGLQFLKEHHEDFIPWAWAINGFSSVLAIPSAILLATHFSLTALIVLGVLFYGLGFLIYFKGRPFTP
jgi:hypothetical protein